MAAWEPKTFNGTTPDYSSLSNFATMNCFVGGFVKFVDWIGSTFFKFIQLHTQMLKKCVRKDLFHEKALNVNQLHPKEDCVI